MAVFCVHLLVFQLILWFTGKVLRCGNPLHWLYGTVSKSPRYCQGPVRCHFEVPATATWCTLPIWEVARKICAWHIHKWDVMHELMRVDRCEGTSTLKKQRWLGIQFSLWVQLPAERFQRKLLHVKLVLVEQCCFHWLTVEEKTRLWWWKAGSLSSSLTFFFFPFYHTGNLNPSLSNCKANALWDGLYPQHKNSFKVHNLTHSSSVSVKFSAEKSP